MKPPAPLRPRAIAFLPVPTRPRADGWPPALQARFIGMVIETGSVSAAARAVGRSRTSAYALRRRPGAASFAAAWDRALGRVGRPGAKFTPAERLRCASESLLQPVLRNGRFKYIVEKHDNSLLLAALKWRLRELERQAERARRKMQIPPPICGVPRLFSPPRREGGGGRGSPPNRGWNPHPNPSPPERGLMGSGRGPLAGL